MEAERSVSPSFEDDIVIAEDASPESVLATLDVLTLEFIRILVTGNGIPVLHLVKRTSDNTLQIRVGHGEDGLKRLPILALGRKVVRRRDTRASLRAYSQTWLLLDALYFVVRQRKSVTQRELFYLLVKTFSNQNEMNHRLQEVVSMTGCPRHCLGVIAASRGFVGGKLKWKNDDKWIDCIEEGPLGVSIPGSFMRSITCGYSEIFQSCARFILVVEKDAIYRRLCEDRIFDRIPCIVVTGCGMPDIATRAFVRALEDSLRIPVLGLFDYNPHGVQIMLVYKHGSIKQGLEAGRYAVNLEWIGMRNSDYEALCDNELEETHRTMPFTGRDNSVLYGLLDRNEGLVKYELEKMKARGKKMELEAFYSRGYHYLAKEYIPRRFLERNLK